MDSMAATASLGVRGVAGAPPSVISVMAGTASARRYGWVVWIVGSPLLTQTSGLMAGMNARLPPGSRVVGTLSPAGWWMM